MELPGFSGIINPAGPEPDDVIETKPFAVRTPVVHILAARIGKCETLVLLERYLLYVLSNPFIGALVWRTRRFAARVREVGTVWLLDNGLVRIACRALRVVLHTNEQL